MIDNLNLLLHLGRIDPLAVASSSERMFSLAVGCKRRVISPIQPLFTDFVQCCGHFPLRIARHLDHFLQTFGHCGVSDVVAAGNQPISDADRCNQPAEIEESGAF